MTTPVYKTHTAVALFGGFTSNLKTITDGIITREICVDIRLDDGRTVEVLFDVDAPVDSLAGRFIAELEETDAITVIGTMKDDFIVEVTDIAFIDTYDENMEWSRKVVDPKFQNDFDRASGAWCDFYCLENIVDFMQEDETCDFSGYNVFTAMEDAIGLNEDADWDGSLTMYKGSMWALWEDSLSSTARVKAFFKVIQDHVDEALNGVGMEDFAVA